MKPSLHAFAMLTLAALGAGCVHFPYGHSADRHNFVSTPHRPLTLTLVNTMTGEAVWALDVPIHKMAVVDLDHSHKWTADQTPHLPATAIRWELFEPDARFGFVKFGPIGNKQELNGDPVVLKVSVRPKGEAYEPLNKIDKDNDDGDDDDDDDDANERFQNPNDLGNNPRIEGVTKEKG